MPKDYEKIPHFDPGPLKPTEPAGFSPDQLVVCEKCGRKNPPTRVNCLYCASPFAFDPNAAEFRQPLLRPMEDDEVGFSNILVSPASISPDVVAQIASLVKLPLESVERAVGNSLPLPLTRIASFDEAKLIENRLHQLDIKSFILPDTDLKVDEVPLRVRAAEISDDGITLNQVTTDGSWQTSWTNLILLVTGRLTLKTLSSTERKASHGESEIVDATETQSDQAVVDVYAATTTSPFRMVANSFDFSCLGERKGLIANENFQRLLELMIERSPSVILDDSYRTARATLDLIWPTEKRMESQGWRRQRLGRVTFGAVTQVSNERQFSRYSRFRHYLRQHPELYEA